MPLGTWTARLATRSPWRRNGGDAQGAGCGHDGRAQTDDLRQRWDFPFASERKSGEQSRLGSTISTGYVRPAAIFTGVIEVSCPRFGPPNMRHGLATFLTERGTDLRVTQRMLRWSGTKMLQRYAHPGRKAKKSQGEFLGRMFRKKRLRVRVQLQQKPLPAGKAHIVRSET